MLSNILPFNKSNVKCLFDENEFQFFIAQSQQELIHFCFQITNNWSDAQDCAQEAYIKAWKKNSSFKEQSQFKTWVYSIAKNICIDLIRDKKRKPELNIDDYQLNSLSNIESDTEISDVFNKLSIDDKLLLFLRIEAGYSFEEISKILKIRPSTARKRFQRAREHFTKLYKGGNNNG